MLIANYDYPNDLQPLNLQIERPNQARKLFALAIKTVGAQVGRTDLNRLCRLPEEDIIDPATRFNNNLSHIITATDAGRYCDKALSFQEVLRGHDGPLYIDTGRDTPTPPNPVLILKFEGKAPGTQRQSIRHAIFLPASLLFITMNTHIDKKDGHYLRIRNAWHIRQNFMELTSDPHSSQALKCTNARLAGRIFGGGDQSTCTLLTTTFITKA